MSTVLIIILLWGVTLWRIKTKWLPDIVSKEMQNAVQPYVRDAITEYSKIVNGKFNVRDEQMAKCFQEVANQGQELDDLYAGHQPPVTQPAGKRGAVVVTGPSELDLPPSSPKSVGPNTVIPDDGLPIGCHSVVTGGTGMGKSNTVITGIMRRLEATHRVIIVDSKNELGQIFDDHAEVIPVEEATDTVNTLIVEADTRMKMFSKLAKELREPILNVDDYEEITGETLPRICMVIEEITAFNAYIDMDSLMKVHSLGRSSGVSCFTVGQTINKDILPPSITRNIDCKVYLGKPDRYAFMSLFPSGIPNEIKARFNGFLGKPGKALIQINNDFQLRELPFVSKDLMKQFM